jgi:hypothetical protein
MILMVKEKITNAFMPGTPYIKRGVLCSVEQRHSGL